MQINMLFICIWIDSYIFMNFSEDIFKRMRTNVCKELTLCFTNTSKCEYIYFIFAYILYLRICYPDCQRRENSIRKVYYACWQYLCSSQEKIRNSSKSRISTYAKSYEMKILVINITHPRWRIYSFTNDYISMIHNLIC